MTFEWPLLLLALLLVPLAVAGYVLVQRRRMRYAARFTNLDLLANVVERSPGWRRHLPPAFALAALAALLIGLARPQATIAVPRERATVVLVMDVSGSMAATDVQPTRLDAAQDAAKSFLDQVPEKFRVGVVSFSSEAQVVATPTAERTPVRSAIDAFRADGGTAIGDAILRAVELARGQRRAASAEGGGREPEREPFSILLLSDGANSAGSPPLEGAAEAKSAGIPVYTIALGTPDGIVERVNAFGEVVTIPVPPDPETLRRIAQETGGRFFGAPDEDELRAVYERLGSQVGFEKEKQEITFAFAAGAGALLLAALTLSALWFHRIP